MVGVAVLAGWFRGVIGFGVDGDFQTLLGEGLPRAVFRALLTEFARLNVTTLGFRRVW